MHCLFIVVLLFFISAGSCDHHGDHGAGGNAPLHDDYSEMPRQAVLGLPEEQAAATWPIAPKGLLLQSKELPGLGYYSESTGYIVGTAAAIEVDPSRYETVVAADAGEIPQRLSHFIREHGAVAGINGGFFGFQTAGRFGLVLSHLFSLKSHSNNLLIVDGKLMSEMLTPQPTIAWKKNGHVMFGDAAIQWTLESDSPREVLPLLEDPLVPPDKVARMVIDGKQVIATIPVGIPDPSQQVQNRSSYKVDPLFQGNLQQWIGRTVTKKFRLVSFESNKPDDLWQNMDYAMSSPIALVRDGHISHIEPWLMDDVGGSWSHFQRTGLCIDSNGNLELFISTADTIMKFAQFAVTIHCVGAINLDGAQSTTMEYNGSSIYPTLTSLDPLAPVPIQRPTHNAVVVVPRAQGGR